MTRFTILNGGLNAYTDAKVPVVQVVLATSSPLRPRILEQCVNNNSVRLISGR
jgi:hypothetical protein